MFSIIREEEHWQRIYERLPAPKTLLHYRYVSAAATLEQDGDAELAVWQDDETLIAHPYIRRAIPQATGFYDLRSAFEFGGFWLGPQSKPLTKWALDKFDRAFEQYCSANSIVCEFIRFHPYLPYLSATESSYELSKQAENVTIALNQSYDQIFAEYHTSKRKQVRQGRRHGLRISTSDDYDTFVKTYHENLDRLDADEFYYFPTSFFQAVCEFLEIKLIRDANGELCAAHCYLRDGDIVHAFLCHARQEKLSLRPNDYAYDSVISDLVNSTYQHFHFGGGAPSLSAYKKQFSPKTVPYVTGRKIFMPVEYLTLAKAHEARIGRPGKSTDYFPAYRAG
jgi:serine/alanine adding enzyme